MSKDKEKGSSKSKTINFGRTTTAPANSLKPSKPNPPKEKK